MSEECFTFNDPTGTLPSDVLIKIARSGVFVCAMDGAKLMTWGWSSVASVEAEEGEDDGDAKAWDLFKVTTSSDLFEFGTSERLRSQVLRFCLLVRLKNCRLSHTCGLLVCSLVKKQQRLVDSRRRICHYYVAMFADPAVFLLCHNLPFSLLFSCLCCHPSQSLCTPRM
jgi:hypothetical protein